MEIVVIGTSNFTDLNVETKNYLFKEGRIESKNKAFVDDLFNQEDVAPVVYDAWGARFFVTPKSKKNDEDKIIEEIKNVIEVLMAQDKVFLQTEDPSILMGKINPLIKQCTIYDMDNISAHRAVSGYHKDKGLSQFSVIVSDKEKQGPEMEKSETTQNQPQ